MFYNLWIFFKTVNCFHFDLTALLLVNFSIFENLKFFGIIFQLRRYVIEGATLLIPS